MTAIREGHWLQLATDLEVWLHDSEFVIGASFYVKVEKLHGNGRVTVWSGEEFFTLSETMLSRITRTENA